MVAFGSMHVDEKPASQRTHADINTFSAFLNEFTGGSWAPILDGGGELRSVLSTSPDGDDSCQISSDSEELVAGREYFCAYQVTSAYACAASDKQPVTTDNFFLRFRGKEVTNRGDNTKSATSNQCSQFDGPRASAKRDASEKRTYPLASLSDRNSALKRQFGKTASISALEESKGSFIAPTCSNLLATRRTLVHASLRTLTNATYLRRLHLGKVDAVRLFPKNHQTIEYVYQADVTRRASLGSMKIATTVSVQDDNGRQWPITLECLRTAGQRHIRLNKGWAAMCRAIGLCVGNIVRLERWEQETEEGQEEALVTISIM